MKDNNHWQGTEFISVSLLKKEDNIPIFTAHYSGTDLMIPFTSVEVKEGYAELYYAKQQVARVKLTLFTPNGLKRLESTHPLKLI